MRLLIRFRGKSVIKNKCNSQLAIEELGSKSIQVKDEYDMLAQFMRFAKILKSGTKPYEFLLMDINVVDVVKSDVDKFVNGEIHIVESRNIFT